jgi:hypothetical protein
LAARTSLASSQLGGSIRKANGCSGTCPAKAIGIELRDEHYSKLVVEVGNPEEQIRQIQETAARISS